MRNEVIHDVIQYDNSYSIEDIEILYWDWNPQNLEEYYIAPGMIDINARVEWDSYETLTRAAVSGGVTFVVAESGHYQHNTRIDQLFCDLGKVVVVDETNLEEITALATTGVFAFKSYLVAPNCYVKGVESILIEVMKKVSMTKFPLIIDPILAEQRMLLLNSPYRVEPIEERIRSEPPADMGIFIASLPNEDSVHGSELEDELTDRSRCSYISTVSADVFSEYLQAFNNRREVKFLSGKVLQEETHNLASGNPSKNNLDEKKHRIFVKKMQGKFTIVDDLARRITKSLESIEDLSNAEKSTYNSAGLTVWNPYEKHDLSQRHHVALTCITEESVTDLNLSSISISIPTELPKRSRFRPEPLNFNKIEKKSIEDNNFLHYIANCPESWEINGVNAILKAIKQVSCRVHIANLSSASAASKIRKEKYGCKSLSCETTASHLYFTNNMVTERETLYKDQPALKSISNCNFLWELLKMNVIDCITSHHISISPEYKFLMRGSLKRALNGLNCMGFSLPSVWTKLKVPVTLEKQLEHYIVRLFKWMSLNPAKIIGVDRQRGSIEKRKFADLVIWEPFEVTNTTNPHSSSPETCVYKDMHLMGRVHQVYIRGNLAYERDTFFPVGKYVQSS